MWKAQHCPYSLEPKRYRADAQSPLPQDDTRIINKEIKQVHKIVGSILYYLWAVDMTVLMMLSTIASEQTKGMERTLEKSIPSTQLLGDAPWCDGAVLSIGNGYEHPFQRFIFEWTTVTQPGMRPFLVGSIPIDGKPIKHNGAFHTLCSILRFLMASATEAEL